MTNENKLYFMLPWKEHKEKQKDTITKLQKNTKNIGEKWEPYLKIKKIPCLLKIYIFFYIQIAGRCNVYINWKVLVNPRKRVCADYSISNRKDTSTHL